MSYPYADYIGTDEAQAQIADRFRHETEVEDGEKFTAQCSHPGALGPCMPRVADGRCVWCERQMDVGPPIKTCPCCAKQYTARLWCALWMHQAARVQHVEAGRDPVAEPAYHLQLVDCQCGSTMAVEIHGEKK